jgi:hypothetical protein
MKKANSKQNEQSTRIKVPKGVFCDTCPYLSGNRCTKASATVTSDRKESLCTDMYFMCKVYDPAGGKY